MYNRTMSTSPFDQRLQQIYNAYTHNERNDCSACPPLNLNPTLVYVTPFLFCCTWTINITKLFVWGCTPHIASKGDNETIHPWHSSCISSMVSRLVYARHDNTSLAIFNPNIVWTITMSQPFSCYLERKYLTVSSRVSCKVSHQRTARVQVGIY